MNILVINYEYPPVGGGGGVICRDICEEIAARGHRVAVITSRFNGLLPFEEINGVEVHRTPVLMRTKRDTASLPSMLSYVPACVWKGTSLFRSRGFDVINTQFAVPSGPAGHYLSGRFRVPNVLTILGGDIFDPSKFLSPHQTFGLKQTVRKMLRGADRVVAESSDVERNARLYYGFNRDIDIVPLGIKPNPYPAGKRGELGLPDGECVFVTIGRLVKRKNLSELLEIFADLRLVTPCILLIIGEGPDRGALERKIIDLNIGDSVKLLGRVDDEQKFRYLSAADAYLSTAIHEGFGLVFLEAMECGLPVVCYDRGGQTDFLKNGVTGYLVRLGDKQEFKEKVRYLLASPDNRYGIGKHNREYVREFHIGRCADRYLGIFEAVVSSRERRILPS
jgi:glycosyltransferase involved in cell wall biosynthesis